jgi:hypothetical protein
MRSDRGIDEVQPHAPLAQSTRLLTIMTVWKALIALQVPLSAGQAARPHALWFICCGRVRRIWAIRRWHRRDGTSSSLCALAGASLSLPLGRRTDIDVELWRGQLLWCEGSGI